MNKFKEAHAFHDVEQDANIRAFLYFNRNVEGFYQTEEQYRYNQNNKIEKGWNFWRNPIDIYNTGIRDNTYIDYYNLIPKGRTIGPSSGIGYSKRKWW